MAFTIAEKTYRCWVWAMPWNWLASPHSLSRLISMSEVQQQPAWKFWLSILFGFLQVAVGLPALGYLMLRGLDCGEGRAAAGFGYTLYGFAIFGFAVALASIVLLFLLNKRTWLDDPRCRPPGHHHRVLHHQEWHSNVQVIQLASTGIPLDAAPA